jgi:hypothetical protein
MPVCRPIITGLLLSDAVDFAKKVLHDITSGIGSTNIEVLLRQAEQWLVEIRIRDFSVKHSEAESELIEAIECESLMNMSAESLILLVNTL